MLISVQHLTRFFGVKPIKGILHVGAHHAEESVDYEKYSWGNVIWVEMLPEKYEALRVRFEKDPRNSVLRAACWDVDGELLPIFRADNGQSSSLLQPELHLTSHPKIAFAEDGAIATSRLDTILPADARFDFLNLDIQGAELRALRGLGQRMADLAWAYVEINTRRLYADCALISEVDAFMENAGFARIVTCMAGSAGWGDALYVNRKLISPRAFQILRMKGLVWMALNAIRTAPRALRPRAIIRSFRHWSGLPATR